MAEDNKNKCSNCGRLLSSSLVRRRGKAGVLCLSCRRKAAQAQKEKANSESLSSGQSKIPVESKESILKKPALKPQVPIQRPAQRPKQPPAQRPAQRPAQQRPTRPSAQRPPQRQTQHQTQHQTQRQTQPPTQSPAQPPTQSPAQPPRQPSAQPPRQPSAQRPTQPPAQRPTQPSAQRPTQPPAQRPTQPSLKKRRISKDKVSRSSARKEQSEELPKKSLVKKRHKSLQEKRTGRIEKRSHNEEPQKTRARETIHSNIKGRRTSRPGRHHSKQREEKDQAVNRGKKKIYLFGGIGAAFVIIFVCLVLVFNGENKKNGKVQNTNKQKSIDVKKEVAVQQEEEQTAKIIEREHLLKEFQRCKEEEEAHPRAFGSLEAYYYNLIYECRNFSDLKDRAEKKFKEIQKMHVAEGKKTLEALNKEVNVLSNDEDQGYRAAVKLFDKMPPEIEGVGRWESDFLALKEEVSKFAKQENYLEKLKEEALSYARKGLYDVAEKIISEGFSSTDFDEDTPLWKRREQLLQSFKTAPLAALLKKERIVAERKKEEKRKKLLQEFAQRRKDFIAGKKALVPKPLLGPYDLINWPLRSKGRPWKLENVDGKGVLTAKPKTGGGNWYLGPNGYDWEDYSLSFKLKVVSGKMVFYPRINMKQLFVMHLRNALPDLSNLGKNLVFDADSYGSDWINVTIDVYGGGDDSVVDVTVTGGKKPGTTQLKGANLKDKDLQSEYPSSGSFIMVMWEGSEIKIQDVNLSLVRRMRKGILD